MTRSDERMAALTALGAAGMLAASLVLTGAGPASAHPNGVVTWYAEHATSIRLGSIMWLLAMLALVAFAVRLRDALLGLTADRWWTNVLFQQGATVFATVAVVAAAAGWSTATLAVRVGPTPDTVAAMWTLHGALLRFASWGLWVPLFAAALALARHSTGGRVAAVLGVGVAFALLTPLTWFVGLWSFAVWLALAGLVLLFPARDQALQTQRVA